MFLVDCQMREKTLQVKCPLVITLFLRIFINQQIYFQIK